MTAEDARRLYPGALVAVAWFEVILCSPPDGEELSGWALWMSQSPPPGPDETLAFLRELLKSEVEDGGECRAAEALAQLDHPDFTIYLCGKMGLV